MTKKDFELIAQTISRLQIEESLPQEQQRALIARQFAIALQNTNNRFNVDKFVEVCK